MTGRIARAIRHVGFEDLGSFAAPLERAGYAIDYIDVGDLHDRPLDIGDPDLLIVLGGPIGVYDHDRYPILLQEIDLLRGRLAADRPTLGICLGAQLIAAALGAKVYPGPAKEIGWSPLTLTESGENSPIAALHEVAVLHWHGDTFDLPAKCELLASTAACRHQAFSRGPNVLALQFHAEPRAHAFEHWLLGHANELSISMLNPQKLRSDAARYGNALEKQAGVVIASWLANLE